ncbi:MAG: hypothetical protein AAB624_03715 [Patescibacteria group bacterium]
MYDKIKNLLTSKNFRAYFSFGSMGAYLIAVVSLSVAWASTKAIQRNYQLMKQVSVLEQEADIAEQKVANQKLENEYYKSDAFLELAARTHLNKAAPGEKLMIVPKKVALSKLPAGSDQVAVVPVVTKTELPNWQAWLQFLTGRGIED